MKIKSYFWIAWAFGIGLVFAVYFHLVSFTNDCPITGDGKNAKMKTADSLKNRPCVSGKANPAITIDKILTRGDDTKRFKWNEYVSIVGYVALVKQGGSETCNCHTKNKSLFDTHIELISSPNKSGHINCMVCEITRYNNNPKLSYAEVKKLKGKKVKVEGYLFFDAEHHQNAINTNPTGTDIWRGTCTEIHPVINIEEVK
jgi:hypothetical protein